ncbi:uncharacterized protein LOC113745002 [Larimichthys crocea]|uniref:uncharacterized protein LOC113745002 n=1 Tax=Larimichthys crocea TaxID=215358 RepID=UPI000F6032FB|nr:uncharacterized protein LOC113745002 [Larimichthys crocea]XP_027132172.1 uncharacterized protein LOC113745002 [Larimichthys crocea]
MYARPRDPAIDCVYKGNSNNKQLTLLLRRPRTVDLAIYPQFFASTMVPVSRRRTLALVLLLVGLQRRGRGSRVWVHSLNQQRRRQGDFYHLVAELRLDSQRHHQYFRMSAEQMDELLALIGPEVTRQSTNYRAAIEPKQRLAVALRYMASGDSLVSLAYSYRLGHSTVINSVHMVCAAIETTMMERFLPRPTQDTWEEVADGFWKKWNFPNCLGAIDGEACDHPSPTIDC